VGGSRIFFAKITGAPQQRGLWSFAKLARLVPDLLSEKKLLFVVETETAIAETLRERRLTSLCEGNRTDQDLGEGNLSGKRFQ
jgi:hypothetical protein